MQISATNLLIAGQQQARPARQPGGNGAFQPAPQAKKTDAADGFDGLLFKQTAPAKPAPVAPAPSGPAQPYAAPQRPGSQIDIRV